MAKIAIDAGLVRVNMYKAVLTTIKTGPTTQLLSGLVFVYIAVLVSIYLASWLVSLDSPFSSTYEGPMLLLGEMLAGKHNIYAPELLLHEPWIVCIYPPLYPACAAILVKCFGLHYFSLRLLSMICCAGAAFLAFRIFRLSGCSMLSSVLATGFLFSFSALFDWSYVARPDMLVTFISLLLTERFVVYVTSQAQSYASDNTTPKHGILNILKQLLPILVLSWLAVIAKQQAIVFILAIVAYLFSLRRIKIAILFALLWLITVGLTMLLLQLITKGFIEHLTFLSAVKASPFVFISSIASLQWDWLKICFVFCLVLIGILRVREPALITIRRFPLLLFFISGSIAYFSMSIPGSNINHLIPALFALCWLAALSLDNLPTWAFIIMLMTAVPSLEPMTMVARYRLLILPYAQNDAIKLQSLDLKNKLVLTDDQYLNYITDSQTVFGDCATFLNVWANKPGNGLDELNRAISSKRYAAIIINSADVNNSNNKPGWWSSSIVKLIEKYYERKAVLHCSGWPADLFLPSE